MVPNYYDIQAAERSAEDDTALRQVSIYCSLEGGMCNRGWPEACIAPQCGLCIECLEPIVLCSLKHHMVAGALEASFMVRHHTKLRGPVCV